MINRRSLNLLKRSHGVFLHQENVSEVENEWTLYQTQTKQKQQQIDEWREIQLQTRNNLLYYTTNILNLFQNGINRRLFVWFLTTKK